MTIRVGTAGWNIPSHMRGDFPKGMSHLEQYSQVFNAVEFNSSFHRSHKKATYERWALATPTDFQFAVKMIQEITHIKGLVDVESDLEKFLGEVLGLQTKLGPLLIQLPPRLIFDEKVANSFFSLLRRMFNGQVALEPCHTSWAEAVTLLKAYNITLVHADPVKVPRRTNSKQLFSYYRLHGSPKVYSSSYDANFLDQLAKKLKDSSWVIFDNTRMGAATQNALDLKNLNYNFLACSK